MPYRARAAEILAKWREVDRQQAAMPAGSPEALALARELGPLRAAYLAVVDEAEAAHAAVPPPFPDAHPAGPSDLPDRP